MTKENLVLALTIVAVAAGMAVPIRADGEPAGEPKNAAEVFDRYLKAVGGADAINAIKSRVTKAETQLDPYGVTGKVETHQKAPNLHFHVFKLDDVGSFERGFDGKAGWSKNPFEGLKDLGGLSLSLMKEDAELHRPARMKALHPNAKLKGKEKKGTVEVFVVELPGKDNPAEAYFDVKSGLLVGGKKEVETQGGLAMEEAKLGDYRDVDGVRIPFSIITSTPEITATTKVLEVKHNVEIADAKFGKPTE